MDKEQIIQWGRQTSALVQEQNADVKYLMTAEELGDFAKLVAAHEREACAKVCAEMHLEGEDDCGSAADAIRARK
jgi:hypothetical protein